MRWPRSATAGAASCRTSSAAGTDAPLVAIQRAGERSVAETPDLQHAGTALLLWTGTYLVLAPDPRPCRTNLRSVSDGTPRSRATCAIGRPLSNPSRAAIQQLRRTLVRTRHRWILDVLHDTSSRPR